MSEAKMTVLKVPPGKRPETVMISDTLEDLQKAVSGYIEVIHPFDDSACIICNEEGKLNGLPLNRALTDDSGRIVDIIAGTFLVAGVSDDGFSSLSAEQIRKYGDMYAKPQMFFRQGGRIRVYSQENEIRQMPKPVRTKEEVR